MKKILITIIIFLLILLAYFAMFDGLVLADDYHILSVEQIMETNDNLTLKIEEANSLQKKDYQEKKRGLSDAVEQLTKEKEEYFDLAKRSTEGELSKANTEETYNIEYLWTRLGHHAKNKGVNLKMDVSTADAGDENVRNLSFTLNGAYSAIIQFISAIEDDGELNFRISNFRLVSNGTNLTATFNVNGIRVRKENSTASTATTTTETQTNDNTTTSTNENTVQ